MPYFLYPKFDDIAQINAELAALILEIRSARNLGARRLQTELMRLHGVSLSLATIHKVLSIHQVKSIKKIPS